MYLQTCEQPQSTIQLIDYLKQQGHDARKRKIRAVEGALICPGKGALPLRRSAGGWSHQLPQRFQSKRFHKQNPQD